MTGPIPEAASRAFEPPSGAASSSAPLAEAPSDGRPPLPSGPRPPLPEGLRLPLSQAEIDAHPELYGWYFVRDRGGKLFKRGPLATDASWGIVLGKAHYVKKK